MVVLHGGGGVEPGQRVTGFHLEGVVGSPVVQVVAEAGQNQRQALGLYSQQTITCKIDTYCTYVMDQIAVKRLQHENLKMKNDAKVSE